MLSSSDQHLQDNREKKYPEVLINADETSRSDSNIIIEEGSENIETEINRGCKAKVSDRELADCIIMDFAGHKEYHSTHQTFLTRNAIYLVVLSLKQEDWFSENDDETGLLNEMTIFMGFICLFRI